jgi:hypothetical protein
MTSPADTIPAGTLASRARQVRVTTVLDVTATAVLTALGWVFGALWFVIVITAMYCASPVAWGFRAGAGRPLPDEKKPAVPGSPGQP